MQAVILCNGSGTRMWPYNIHHNKVMLPLATRPLLKHTIDSLFEANVDTIVLTISTDDSEIKHHFGRDTRIKIVEVSQQLGTSDTLLKAKELINQEFVCLYGDCYIDREDIIAFCKQTTYSACVSRLHNDSTEMICTMIENNLVTNFVGHPRGSFDYFACGFKFDTEVFEYLPYNCGFFDNTKVGLGAPKEKYLESSIHEMIENNIEFNVYYCVNQVVDLDKPWDLMEANQIYNHTITTNIMTTITPGSTISDEAIIRGEVVLGKNSHIGSGVIIEGNCIIGDNTIIDNGAIIGSNCVIGNNCSIKNNCKIASHSSIGNNCIIDHTAEFLGGVLFDKVYLYHYGEYYGVIGKNSDLGAGTTCGTLRFDDGNTSHYVKGKRINPKKHGNACYIGDYSRTGVGVILQPGCKIGNKCVVSSGVILNEDLEDNTLIYPKQELIKKPWGDNKYNW